MMGQWGEFGGWGMGFGFVFMILFWVLVVAGIVALVRWLLPARDAAGPRVGELPREKTPLEIVQERYARGEIDREEYEQKRRDLEK
ncbi:SHOCT domain-containing protein [Sedimenticola selenatireducens]|uniref:SHOCT domain-containing protein n=1 Tax=Sedimenticola selenatireducens TaxID=191960 RepID=UPI00048ACFF8|nr:SHOCT domain-containing protein [Sedimenticola selenatireducens]